MNTLRIRLLSAAALLLASAMSSPAVARQELNFQVYLGDRAIGTHRFEVVPDAQGYRVLSEASFSVRFLMFEAYRYEHRSEEVWQRDCLRAIEARTQANGDRYFVQGRAEAGVLQLDSHAGATRLEGCVMTFAYWNPAILRAERLLNVQTGDYLDVRVTPLGERMITDAKNGTVAARGYRLSTSEAEIDVWYSPQDELLALESTTARGDRLRYAAQ
jgi:hypothetical protein